MSGVPWGLLFELLPHREMMFTRISRQGLYFMLGGSDWAGGGGWTGLGVGVGLDF